MGERPQLTERVEAELVGVHGRASTGSREKGQANAAGGERLTRAAHFPGPSAAPLVPGPGVTAPGYKMTKKGAEAQKLRQGG